MKTRKDDLMGKRTLTKLALLGMAVAPVAGFATEAAEVDCHLSGLQMAAGYITFSNVISFMAVVGACLFGGAFLFALRDALARIPLAVWKACGYAGTAALIGASRWAGLGAAAYVEFAGAVAAAAMLAVLMSDVADLLGIEKREATVWNAGVMLMAGAQALIQGNSMVAGVSVGALMGLLGFTAFNLPGMVGVGFDGKGAIWRGIFGALAALIPAALVKIGYGSLGALEVFWPAIGWLCSMVAAVGLLIVSSRFFESRADVVIYLARNIAMLGFGLFCVWAGSVHGLTEMSRVGGTFLAIWLFEKPWDIPSAGKLGYSFIGLASCVGVFWVVRLIGEHPDKFGKFFLF